MAKEGTLRRGKPEARRNYERAKDEFEAAKGETRVSEHVDVCPECGEPMTLRKSYREPQQYRFEGICSKTKAHNIERYGFYSTEGS